MTAVDFGIDKPLDFNVLVDRGLCKTILLIPKRIFTLIEAKAEDGHIKGHGTSTKLWDCNVLIYGEKAGLLTVVSCGGSAVEYLGGQFTGCSGILGLDILRHCSMSLCNGRLVIHSVGLRPFPDPLA